MQRSSSGLPAEEVCICGRSFTHSSALNKHRTACRQSKKRLSSALDKAKQLWTGSKRRRLQSDVTETNHQPPSATGLLYHSSRAVTPESSQIVADDSANADQVDDSQLSMMERRPWSRRLNRRMPLRFRDILPQAPPHLPPAPIAQSAPSSDIYPPQSHVNMGLGSLCRRLRQVFTTEQNIFGISRRYKAVELPSHDPEEQNLLSELSDISPQSSPLDSTSPTFYPYPNHSSFRLGDWYWNGGVQKSQSSFKELIDIVGDPKFQSADIWGTNWRKINHTLAGDDQGEWIDDAGWTNTPVTIRVPYHPRRGIPPDPSSGPRDYTIPEFRHHNLVSVIREKLSSPTSNQHFHYEPYELNWQPGESERVVRAHGELYTSPAFIDAHSKLQDSPVEPGCDLPRVVVALMFWSDVTHLTSFGDAKIWPLYLFFGNESKYRRCKPSCNLCHHVAYFQKLPADFKDFAATQTAGGYTPDNAFMTHCDREFMHAQWDILLDDEFLEAWKHGIVVTCCDGIKRRFYPRFFTYSADYPEKILLAGIRNLGNCPCPRCLIPMTHVPDIGMARDKTQRVTLARVDDTHRKNQVTAARAAIYDRNLGVASAAVENLLKPTSLVPNRNSFSDRLSAVGFDFYSMFVVDMMHDFELGVWKALFIHILRILESHDRGKLVAELDRRYREVPSFGRDTVRRFTTNCSELRNMAARDFENLLQCAIPVFEGLLPEPYNSQILQLLFVAAHWHGLAKLRVHNDLTLDVMDAVTTSLGDKLREFNDETCSAFITQELDREFSTRIRRQTKKSTAKMRPPKDTSVPSSLPQASESVSETSVQHQLATEAENMTPVGPRTKSEARRLKTFNLYRYKVHSLGDYTTTIRQYGTTDSYSTEAGELEHRLSKARYTRTSRKQFTLQLTQIERRQARIRRIRERYRTAGITKNEDVPSAPDVHHVIGKSENHPENISMFVQKNTGDPAVKDFIPRLKDHLLPRVKAALVQETASAALDIDSPSSNRGLVGVRYAGESDGDQLERDFVHFKSNRMYRHHLVRFNYTTYDIRRAQDVINPNTSHCDIMLLADSDHINPEDDSGHRFLYARVLGAYHVNVVYTGPGMLDYKPRRLDFLWVRWFQYVGRRSVEWNGHRLDSVRFPPMASDNAFDFIDPRNVLRGCHIIPAFIDGRVHPDGIGLSRVVADSRDWRRYYVGRFVDRDMIMRYHWGLAIGHLYARNRSPDTATQYSPDVEMLQCAATERPLDYEAMHSLTANLDERGVAEHSQVLGDEESDVDQAELGLRNREDDEWEDVGHEDDQAEESDDDVLVSMDEMYG